MESFHQSEVEGVDKDGGEDGKDGADDEGGKDRVASGD